MEFRFSHIFPAFSLGGFFICLATLLYQLTSYFLLLISLDFTMVSFTKAVFNIFYIHPFSICFMLFCLLVLFSFLVFFYRKYFWSLVFSILKRVVIVFSLGCVDSILHQAFAINVLSTSLASVEIIHRFYCPLQHAVQLSSMLNSCEFPRWPLLDQRERFAFDLVLGFVC